MANMPQQQALLATTALQVLTAQVKYALALHVLQESTALLLRPRYHQIAPTVLRASTLSRLDLPPATIALHVLQALSLLQMA